MYFSISYIYDWARSLIDDATLLVSLLNYGALALCLFILLALVELANLRHRGQENSINI
jgi:hypothetical protein